MIAENSDKNINIENSLNFEYFHLA